DVEHHGDRRVIHLIRHLPITPKFRPFNQRSDAIALLCGGLPDAQILESINAHAEEIARAVPAGPGAKDKGNHENTKARRSPKNPGPGTDQGPRTKYQGPV